MVWTKVNHWNNTTLYQVDTGKASINVEIETKRDKVGSLKLATCSLFGTYEGYGWPTVKTDIEELILKNQKP